MKDYAQHVINFNERPTGVYHKDNIMLQWLASTTTKTVGQILLHPKSHFLSPHDGQNTTCFNYEYAIILIADAMLHLISSSILTTTCPFRDSPAGYHEEGSGEGRISR